MHITFLNRKAIPKLQNCILLRIGISAHQFPFLFSSDTFLNFAFSVSWHHNFYPTFGLFFFIITSNDTHISEPRLALPLKFLYVIFIAYSCTFSSSFWLIDIIVCLLIHLISTASSGGMTLIISLVWNSQLKMKPLFYRSSW